MLSTTESLLQIAKNNNKYKAPWLPRQQLLSCFDRAEVSADRLTSEHVGTDRSTLHMNQRYQGKSTNRLLLTFLLIQNDFTGSLRKTILRINHFMLL